MKTQVSVWLTVVIFVLAQSNAMAKPSVTHPQTTAQTIGKFIPKKSSTCSYLVYLPKNYGTEEKEWPLILFLHGSHQRGGSLATLPRCGLLKFIESKEDFPFIVVSPQCPKRKYWSEKLVDGLLDEVLNEYSIDSGRIYLTGLSMGGFGTWTIAGREPDRFAAIAPICGGGKPDLAENLVGVPTWAFHGAKDKVVPLRRSVEMIEAIRKAGGKAQLTVYPNAGHDAWTETYKNPKLYEWFLQHKREG